MGVDVESSRGAHRCATAGGAVRHIAAVSQLDRAFGSLGVYGVGYALQARDYLFSHPELTVERQAAAVYGCVGKGGHPNSATGHSHMVVIQVLRRTVTIGHVLECGRTDNAVAQCHRADFNWSEDGRFHSNR